MAGLRKIKSKSRTITFIVAFIFFLFYTLYILYFLTFVILIAIKPSSQAYIQDMINVNLFTIHKEATLSNFTAAFSKFAPAIPSASPTSV